MHNIHEYRSAIFMPGANEKMLAKVGSLNADLVLFDLEDSVDQTKKSLARKLVSDKLTEFKSDPKSVGVRVNDLSSGLIMADLEAILPAKPDLIILPKVESGDDLIKLDNLFKTIEKKTGMTFSDVKLIILTAETPGSLFRFDTLTNASGRLVGMTWGAEDLASELGAVGGRDQLGNWLPPFQLAQTLCLAKARDLKVHALDTVYTDIKNTEGLRIECNRAKQLGFTGKLAIHPSQLDTINEVFSPSQQEVDYARELVQLFFDNPGVGALELNGRMVDIPHLRSAKQLLARYKAGKGTDTLTVK